VSAAYVSSRLLGRGSIAARQLDGRSICVE
jgi:hypothetical protein